MVVHSPERAPAELARERAALAAFDPATILESISDAFFAVDREWRIVYANRRALQFWRTSAAAVLGRPLWDCFPQLLGQPPEIGFRRAMAEGTMVEFETVSPISRGWVSTSAYPAEGGGLAVYFRDIAARKREEEERRESEDRLRLAVQATGLGTWDIDPVAGRRTWSPEFRRICGLAPDAPAEASLVRALIHPDDRALVEQRFERAFDPAEEGIYQAEFRLRRADDAAERWMLATGRVLFDAARRPVRAIGTLLDITERKQAEAQHRMLLAELDHRVKNTLATVQSVAMQTLRTASSPEAFTESFAARLLALSVAHDLLRRGGWRQTSLSELIADMLAPFAVEGEARVIVAGPAVAVGPYSAFALGMAFHELATNAAKYGALSAAPGRVEVAWRLVADAEGEQVALTWRERGGPPTAPPRRRGFGSRLIERGLAHQLRAAVEMRFDPAGFVCDIRFPAAQAAKS
ncbi:MAG: HWE histidine kinase domain-containing protein [Dongiaceae bacterium]